MRRWTLEAGGRRFDVTVRPDGDELVVAVDGREARLRLGPIGAGHGRVFAEGRSIAFGWGRRPEGYALVLDGTHLEIAVRPPGAGGGAGGARAAGAQEVVVAAPLPGKVRGVLVAAGDAVEKGGALLLLDAMKLENEIQAPVRGAVESVHVRPGDSVEHGQRLVVLREGP